VTEFGIALSAHEAFERAMREPDNLIAIARRETGRGRRAEESSLNRAAVVTTVAAWQVLCEGLAGAALAELEQNGLKGQLGAALSNLVSESAATKIKRFNTPNSSNSIDLFAAVGVDIEAVWDGLPFKRKRLELDVVKGTLNGWVNVRHQVAHGESELKGKIVLNRTTKGYSLRRIEAERCMSFFRALGIETSTGVDRRYGKASQRARQQR